MSPKNVHEKSPKKRTSSGQKCPRDVTKSVHKMSPLLSTRSHPLCPRDVCHPVLNFNFHLLPKSIRDGFKKNQICHKSPCVPWKKGGKYWSSLPIQNRLNVRYRYFMHICRSYVICISGVVYYYYLILHTLQMFYP